MVALTFMAWANAPDRSPRPLPNPGNPGAPTQSPVSTVIAQPVLAPRASLRPQQRENDRPVHATQQPTRPPVANRGNGLCGQAGLTGDRLTAITGSIAGCGIAEPIRLQSVDGIALTTPAIINCNTARALQNWVQDTLVPTVGRRGGGAVNLRVVASYACRTRNSQRGARLSEHSLGNAIDIAGIGLNNGTELTVLTDWRSGREGRMLDALHRGACGPFGTVLGPNSDRFHQDHFHFDVATYRSGPYCR